MIHSKRLEETVLWKAYQEKTVSESTRASWVKEVCEAAIKYMMDVRQTFQNYTLHDGTHIINVLDAMGGVLGNQVSQLTVGEMELLILAVSLHDLGMVYTEEEKRRHFQDAEACGKFLKEYCPEYLDCPAEDWTEDIRQWYLRTLHPFRIPEVLQNEVWKELFAGCPLEVIPKRYIIAVCKAHGENPQDFSRNRDLEYLAANDADPLFCAILLRLCDLLDFDDTRAPKVLYGYVACNEKSRVEWDKHQASAGFRYPATPSTDDLPYKAICTNPGVEHAVRDLIASFFDVSIDELFSISSLERIRDMVMKYSVLRDDNSFREAMDCLKSQIQTVDASLENGMGDRKELEKQKTELESLQMHLLLQQSRESAQRALELSESLVRKTQEMPYKLQRLQLRFMLGYGRQELQECENIFREKPAIDTLRIYFEMLDNVQYYEKILELCHSDEAVAALMLPPSGENIRLWEQCVNAAKEMKDLELTEKYGEYIMKYGAPGARYRLLRSLAVLYKEKHMDEKYSAAKEQLFSLLGELQVDSYWYERNRAAIEQL